uniref:Putative salivary secreted lipocalin n=1 Tax=Ornithodoros turicata TaxID=34597 RepID=A0A2R5LA72_9ACAR
MLSLVVFLAGSFFVATAHADCQDGPYDAKKSIVGPGTGKYYLVKSTFKQDISCLYMVPPNAGTAFPAPYPFGYKKNNGEWVSTTGTVDGDGPNILDSDAGFGATNTTLLYSDYKECDVGLFHGGNVGGPHLELFQHSDATKGSEGLKCCEDRFQDQLKKMGKTDKDVVQVNKDCSYPAQD